VAGDAVHALELGIVDGLRVDQGLGVDVIDVRAVRLFHPHQRDILLRRIGCQVINRVFDVPVDAVPQPLGFGAAASLQDQVRGGFRIGLVLSEGIQGH